MRIRILVKTILGYPRLLKHKMRKNHFGVGTIVETNVFMSNCKLGRYVYIGKDCVLNFAKIGSYSSIAPGVQIGGMEHNYLDFSTCMHLNTGQHYGSETFIGEDVWIGAGTIIKQGVTIGRGAVIGANSFVTKNVEQYSVYFGTPAKFYKKRFTDDIINSLEKSRYWEFSQDKAKEILESLKSERQ